MLTLVTKIVCKLHFNICLSNKFTDTHRQEVSVVWYKNRRKRI